MDGQENSTFGENEAGATYVLIVNIFFGSINVKIKIVDIDRADLSFCPSFFF